MAETYTLSGVVRREAYNPLATLPDSVVTGVPVSTSVAAGGASSASLGWVGAPCGGLKNAMMTGKSFLVKHADGSLVPSVIDAERSNPAIGLIYTRKV